MTTYYPIALDPFTDIVAVHWPTKGITKLDFVGNRYMVRGLDQELADVLGDDLPNAIDPSLPPYHDGSVQRSWRTADGLDLRQYDDFGLRTAGNKAYLKNKTATPDKKNPGALNEFLFIDGTVVMEFDWVDIVAALREQSPGGFADGFDVAYEIFTNANQVTGEFLTLGNAELMQQGTTATYSNGSWQFPSAGGDLYGPPVLHYEVDPPPGFLPPRPLAIPEGQTLRFDFPPPDELFVVYAEYTDQPFTIVPELALYETGADSPPIDGRVLGGRPDDISGSIAPLTNGTLPAPYGRVRVAFTVNGTQMIASVNGGNPVILKGPALFTREPPLNDAGTSQLTYFPIFPNPDAPTRKNYEAYFGFPGVVRCVWLYREQKTPASLKTLSVVKTLTPPDDPKWKTT